MKNIKKRITSLFLLISIVFTSLPAHANIGGKSWTRVQGYDFPFATAIRENFSGLAYNPLTNSIFMVDSESQEILEMNLSGTTLIRAINASGLSPAAGASPDLHGITWLYGNTFAVVMETHGELAFVTLPAGTTSVSRATSPIFVLPEDLKFNCQAIAYNPKDGFFYAATQNDFQLYKFSLNLTTLAMSLVGSQDFSSVLPTHTKTDMTFLPRLTPHLVLVAHGPDNTNNKVIEVAVNSGFPQAPGTLVREFNLSAWPIPFPGGITFGSDGRMFVVTESEPGEEHHFNAFQPSPVLANQSPVAQAGAATLTVTDTNNNGNEAITIDGSTSNDPDGVIIDYEWKVGTTVVKTGFGPNVGSLTHTFAVGPTQTVTLTVRDDVRVAATDTVQVTVNPNAGNVAPTVDAGTNQNTTILVSVGDGTVNQLDYNTWKSSFGDTPASPDWYPPADMNKNGVVDTADYTVWRDKLGTSDNVADINKVLPNGPKSLALNATVTDDNKPLPVSLTTTWSVQSGPSGVTFLNAANIDTTVNFTNKGNYVLKLSAFDGEFTTVDLVNVQVAPEDDLLPSADAIVPAQVYAGQAGNASFQVDATPSFDPNPGDFITRYLWQEVGGATLLDTPQKTGILSLSGLGNHTVRLTVFSNNGVVVTTSPVTDFIVSLQMAPPATLGGRNYSRTVGIDFPFYVPDVRQAFSGLTYNPLSNTFFLTDRDSDEIIEFNVAGDAIRFINISSFSIDPNLPADAEGIAWLHGETFAVVLEGQAELLTFNIPAGVTVIERTNAAVYTLPTEIGNPEGVAYSPRDGFIYVVNENAPFKIFKLSLNAENALAEIAGETDLSGILVAGDALSEISFSARISPNAFVINKNPLGLKVMEIALGPVGTLVGSLELKQQPVTVWNIPRPQGLAFGPDGRMYVVSENEPGPEEHYNVFVPNPAGTANGAPTANTSNRVASDTDGNGSEVVALTGAASTDPNNGVNWYVWKLQNGTLLSASNNPVFNFTANVGVHNLTLQVADREGLFSTLKAFTVTVLPPGGSGSVDAGSSFNVNYVHPGSASKKARIPYEGGGSATIIVVDQLGNKVLEETASSAAPGQQYLEWDFRKQNGELVSSGVYRYFVKNSDGNAQKGKLIFIR